MKKLLKILTIIIGVIILTVILIALAGIYKFNFTDSDIYITEHKGEVATPGDSTTNPDSTNQVDESWISLIDEGNNLSFRYPPDLKADYISPSQWPPKITVNNTAFDCPETDAASSLPERITQQTINGQIYCIKANSEGAAGSVYTEYTYSTVENNELINMEFTWRYPQCYNYDEPAQTACQTERENFKQDDLIDQIARNLKHWDSQTTIISTKNTETETASSQIAWNQIKEAISNCEVKSIMQAHSLEVGAVLKNGETIKALEPKIDEIFSIVNEVKDKCGKIIMATE